MGCTLDTARLDEILRLERRLDEWPNLLWPVNRALDEGKYEEATTVLKTIVDSHYNMTAEQVMYYLTGDGSINQLQREAEFGLKLKHFLMDWEVAMVGLTDHDILAMHRKMVQR